MIKYENDCVSCGLPCLGDSCPYYNAPHFYCDKCHDESDELFWYDEKQFCKDCLLEIIPKVEID